MEGPKNKPPRHFARQKWNQGVSVLAVAFITLVAVVVIVIIVLAFGQGEGRRTGRLAGLLDEWLFACTVRRTLLGITVGLRVLLLVLHLLRLRRGQNAEIVLRMLKVVFRPNPVACRIRVAGELQILFINVGGRSADFDLGAVGIERTVRVVAAATATAAMAILTAMAVLRPAAASSRALHWCPFKFGRIRPVARFVIIIVLHAIMHANSGALETCRVRLSLCQGPDAYTASAAASALIIGGRPAGPYPRAGKLAGWPGLSNIFFAATHLNS